MPPFLKKSINLAYLENGTYNQIVAHLERELKLSGIENNGELPMPTLTITAARDNENKPDDSKTSCLYCKKLGHLIKDCRKRNRRHEERKHNHTQNVQRFTPKTYSLCPHCQKTNHPPKKCWNGPRSANRPQNSKRHLTSGNNQENPKEGTSKWNTRNTLPSLLKKTL